MADLFDIMKAKGLEVPKSVEEKKVTKNEKSSTKSIKKVEKIVEVYTLPLILYYAGSEHVIESNSFPDVESLSKEELLTYIQTILGYRKLTDKRTTLEYEKETGEIVIHLNNPSKGYSFGLQRKIFSDGSVRFVRNDAYGLMVGPAEEYCSENSELQANPGLHLKDKVPAQILYKIIEEFLSVYPKEHLAQIYYDRNSEKYILHFPDQETTTSHIKRSSCSFYLEDRNVVLFSEIHSHGSWPAVFSKTDNENEVDYLLYGVLGSFGDKPNWSFRLGFGGLFLDVDASDVFDFSEGEVL